MKVDNLIPFLIRKPKYIKELEEAIKNNENFIYLIEFKNKKYKHYIITNKEEIKECLEIIKKDKNKKEKDYLKRCL